MVGARCVLFRILFHECLIRFDFFLDFRAPVWIVFAVNLIVKQCSNQHERYNQEHIDPCAFPGKYFHPFISN